MSDSPWMSLGTTDNNVATTLWRVIAHRFKQRPDIFCDLRSSSRLGMAADFSGDQSDSRYHTVAFLLFDEAGLPLWKARLAKVRSDGLGRRHMAFKRLSDGVREKALPAYLRAGDRLIGYCVVVAFNKQLAPLVEDLAQHTEVPAPLANWPVAVRRKALHIALVGALLMASVCAAKADLVCVIDDDAVTANEQRQSEFITLLRRLVAEVSARKFGTLTYRTTGWPNANLFIEDICALPDLAAGIVMDVLRQALDTMSSETLSKLVLRPRSRVLLDWFLGNDPGLTRLAVIVDPADRPYIAVARLLPQVSRAV